MFSVLIATYNGSKYIIEQLESIVHQTLPPNSIYIYDDCSTDNTIEVVSKWKKQNNILNLYIKKNSINKGYTRNFLEALFEIEDEYIFLCDQDDVWKLDKIEEYSRVVNKLESNIPLLITSSYSITDENLKLKDSKCKDSDKITNVKLNEIIKWYSFPGMTFLINKQLKQVAKELFNMEKVYFHDYYLALIATKYGAMHFIHKSFVLYRQHGNNQVGVSGKNRSINHWMSLLEQRKKEMETALYICSDNKFVMGKYLFAEKRFKNFRNKKNPVFSIFKYLKYYNLKSYFADLYYSIIVNHSKHVMNDK